MLPEDSLSVGEIAARTGVAVSALHYYERLGLVVSHRTGGNQRRYARHMVRRVSLIVVAKNLGIPLSEVEEAFAPLPHSDAPTAGDWHRVAVIWKASLTKRRERLERLERELQGCIGCGCLSMKACYLLNPQDELAAKGPGPQRI
ncbi:redox-sensitive transcriptional activator SoxR [Galactobacter caseinivorans]|uniref:Redox-sensitive transcriptional activator SoxR n=1 Tax=Galactobacter caseinivorans TaxID=2676123 RepID=A0A496PIY5_9MICC|nr:redox-sensitive transcriptional activator SoxR [Galactobacter caseinivorans]RKW70429.1 redox-sensitive transcriptional activator SoxR [Galactobacter caseinivorans]